MPQFDQSGPMGQGPKTGKQQGKCSVKSDSKLDSCFPGRGLKRKMRFQTGEEPVAQEVEGRRRGHGFGRGNRPGHRLRQRQ